MATEQRGSSVGAAQSSHWFQVLSFLVHSNFLIALAATGVAVTTMAVLSYPLDPLPLAFVFVAAMFGYTVNRFTDRAVDAYNLPERAAFIDQFGRRGLAISGVGFIGAITATALYVPHMLPVALLPLAVAVIYSTSFVDRYFFCKNGLVGLVWAAIPIGMGSYFGTGITWELGVFAALIFLFLTAAAILFDIKDIAGDQVVGCRTLPVCVGAANARRLAAGLLILSVPLILLAAAHFHQHFYLLLGYPGYLLATIPFASQERGTLFYGLIIDGEHIVVAGIAIFLLMV